VIVGAQLAAPAFVSWVTEQRADTVYLNAVFAPANC